MNEPPTVIFARIEERPERRLVLRRGKEACGYFAYCAEVGCDVWERLLAIGGTLGEPMGMWLPESMRLPGTSQYVQGVEIPMDADTPAPEGFETVILPPCAMLVFQGTPYKEENIAGAIALVQKQLQNYNPLPLGYEWADAAAPRFQLEPRGSRGYIEGRPVRRIGADNRQRSPQL